MTQLKFDVMQTVDAPKKRADFSGSEDAQMASETMIAIADGATGLSKKRYLKGYSSDAQWLSHEYIRALSYIGHMRTRFKNHAYLDDPRIVHDEASCLVMHCAGYASLDSAQNAPAYALPTSTSVLAVLSLSQPGSVSFALVGDGQVVHARSGNINVYYGSRRLAEMEAEERVHREILRKKGLSDEEARIAAEKERRSSYNRPGSYSVVTAYDNAWILHPETRYYTNITIEDGDDLFICSDGMARAVKYGKVKSMEDLYCQSTEPEGMKKIARAVRAFEKKNHDDVMAKYATLSDDISAIHVKVCETKQR